MSTLAPRAAPIFGAIAGELRFLKQRRGVAAVAPAACGEMVRETSARRVGAEGHSAPRQKRARSGFDVKTREGFGVGEVLVVPAPALHRLAERMGTELDAVRDLYKKAKLLSRGAGKSAAAPDGKDERFLAAEPRQEAPMEAAAKRRKISPSEPLSEAAQQSTEPEKKQRPVKQRAAPTKTKRSTTDLIDEAKEALKRRRLEEIARLRQKARQEILEVERAAQPEETIHSRDLEELGIAGFEYAVTRTRKQARRSPG
ncbi:uncharacterized protein LOC133904748 [Phragmites australis]|uniref:uncharacterized protein LOC133904748 n=1 Tax=Phragmites australis TaxID=29695 RepID=UPI002D799C0C|nr:uncharacterized protein LOC133904748 [Phragmites australis]